MRHATPPHASLIRILPLLAALATLAALAGCGGGGGSGTSSSASTAPDNVTMTVSGKALDFSWTPNAQADHYRILVNPDGMSGFGVVPGADHIAATATGYRLEIPVHKTDWAAAQYLVEGCNADESTCTASPNQPLKLIDSIAATIYVKASNTGNDDAFGIAVALSGDGNTLAVGATDESSAATGIDGDQSDNTAAGAGAVYIFTRTSGTWSQQAYIKASNTDPGDWFGIAVALSDDGNTLAVGAYKEDSAATGIGGNQADNTATNSGAVYVFTRTSGTWSQQAYIKASNTDPGDWFGGEVALSGDGNTLAVSARYESSATTGINGSQGNNNANAAGAVYVFTRTSGTWSQQAYIKASNTDPGDWFGWSLALSGDGNTLAVTASDEDSAATGIGGDQADNTAASAGAAYVFTRTSGTWSQQAYIKASNAEAYDNFGWSVALSGDGDTLAVGASTEDSTATGIGGDQTDDTATDAGAVYVFTRTAGTWSQQAYIKASNTEADDNFGLSVALNGNGNTLAVGTNYESSAAAGIDGDQTDNSAYSAGAVYVFSRTSGAWAQRAYVKASNPDSGDEFGQSLALSQDGNTLAVGAYYEDSAATGIDGNQSDNTATDSGAVYLY